jgi:hypothetical protein
MNKVLSNDMTTPGMLPEEVRKIFAAYGAKSKGHKGRTLTTQESKRILAIREKNRATRAKEETDKKNIAVADSALRLMQENY